MPALRGSTNCDAAETLTAIVSRALRRLPTNAVRGTHIATVVAMIRKLTSGQYRLYSRKKDPQTGKRRNLGTFATLAAAKRHERAVQFFKRH